MINRIFPFVSDHLIKQINYHELMWRINDNLNLSIYLVQLKAFVSGTYN
jgi:hypothetical protein